MAETKKPKSIASSVLKKAKTSVAKKSSSPKVQSMPSRKPSIPKKSKPTDESAATISKIIDEIEPIKDEDIVSEPKKVKKVKKAPETTKKATKKTPATPKKPQKKISITSENEISIPISTEEDETPKETVTETLEKTTQEDLATKISSAIAESSASLVTTDHLNPDTEQIVASVTEALTQPETTQEPQTEEKPAEPTTEKSDEEDAAEPIKVKNPKNEPIRQVKDSTMVRQKRRRPQKPVESRPMPNRKKEELSDLLSDFTKDDEKSVKKVKKIPKKALPFRIFSRILVFVTLISVTGILIRLGLTNIVPPKYFISACVGLGIFILLFMIFAFRRKTGIWLLVILDLLGAILSAGSIYTYIKIDETMRFLHDNLNDAKVVSIYNIVVSKDSRYNSLNDVKGRTFYGVSEFTNTANLERAIAEQANANIRYDENLVTLLDTTMEKPDKIAIINSGTYDAIIDVNQEYSEKLKVIATIEVEATEMVRKDSNLTQEPFILYLAGIDTRSGDMPEKSLTDVNILITVNPKSKHILMVSVPRDYYVQLHGTTGLKDKLTHAGMLGGLQLSISTIEDLLGLKIDQYLRVNFNAVVGFVDAIGGITVNSDADFSFKCWTDRGCTFYPGDNKVDGRCALAFARERHAYQSGDRHRAENQEQVLKLVIEKITSSTTLISKYSDILNSLSGHFESSLTPEDITSLVNMQLDHMTPWKIESYNLDGQGAMDYTYSFRNQKLYVAYPDESTITTAKNKINEVLAE